MLRLRPSVILLMLSTLVFATLSTWAGLASPGFLEADACTHYQYSRWVWHEPYRLIDMWGRPVCTTLYAIPALLGGRAAVHVTSLLVALALAWITRRIAKLQEYDHPALAYLFVLAQPLVFFHSFSELTELPFALLMAVAFLAYREKRWWELALVAGVMPLARPEGFGMLLLSAGALFLHGRWRYLVILPIPMAIWSYGGWALSGSAGHWYQWLPANWPYSATSLYTPGPLLHFVALLPALTGPFIFPALLLGLLYSARELWATVKEWGLFEVPHQSRCDFLIAFIPSVILAAHSYLYWRGKMASNGELRYLLVAAPFWALLLAKGVETLWRQRGFSHIYAFAALATLAPAWIQIPKIGYPCLPLIMFDDWKEAASIATWYKTSGIAARYPHLMNSHPGVPYALDISPNDPDRTVPWIQKTLRESPPGTLLVWDPIYGVYSADAARSIKEQDILRAGWVLIDGPPNVNHSWPEWRFFLSPKDINNHPSHPDPTPADLRPGNP